MSYRILVAEDDEGLNEGIRLALRQKEVSLLGAYTLEEAWTVFVREQPQMVLLDINFPDGSGFSFLRRLRGVSDIPVLVITANDMELDEVKGLTLGADDYITKPFSLLALRARVESVRRRTERAASPVYNREGCFFDFERFIFTVDGQEISLGAAEQRLLRYFVAHPGQTLSREVLAGKLWPDGMEFVDENALSVTVSRLRKKLSRKGRESPIETVYGIGYVWRVE